MTTGALLVLAHALIAMIGAMSAWAFIAGLRSA